MVTASQAMSQSRSSSSLRARGGTQQQRRPSKAQAENDAAEQSAAFWKRPKGVVRTEDSSKTDSHYNIPASYDAIWENAIGTLFMQQSLHTALQLSNHWPTPDH